MQLRIYWHGGGGGWVKCKIRLKLSWAWQNVLVGTVLLSIIVFQGFDTQMAARTRGNQRGPQIIGWIAQNSHRQAKMARVQATWFHSIGMGKFVRVNMTIGLECLKAWKLMIHLAHYLFRWYFLLVLSDWLQKYKTCILVFQLFRKTCLLETQLLNRQ